MELKNTSANWKTHWDTESQTPFAVSGSKIIVYDNEQSIAEKIRFAMEKNLAGAMVWSIDTDDFFGDCSSSDQNDLVNFPLMRCINKSIVQSLEEIQNAIIHGYSPHNTSVRVASNSVVILALLGFLSLVL